MSRKTEQDWAFSQVNERKSGAPVWRRVVTVVVAAVFTLVTISLGLIRHRHAVRDDSGFPLRASYSKPQSEHSP